MTDRLLGDLLIDWLVDVMTSFWQMGFEIAKPRVRDSGMNSYEWSNEFNKKDTYQYQ